MPSLLNGSAEVADAALVSQDDSRARLRRVAQLIEGFETPYGMELLSSVHWVATHGETTSTVDEAIRAVHAWNDRKKRFTPDQIRLAWETLQKKGWLRRTAEA